VSRDVPTSDRLNPSGTGPGEASAVVPGLVGTALATGVGSLPGDDPRAALREVFELLPELPYLPELPGRGHGATMIGRGVALLGLAGYLHADVQPSGWRIVDRPGLDERRALDLLDRDLDALEEVATGWSGPLKLSVVGPLTAAASLELTRGEAVLADHGASRDLAEAMAETASALVAEVRRRVPGAHLLVQVDEPSLPAVRAGQVPTASGFGRLRSVDEATTLERLGGVLGAISVAGAFPLVHCCAASPPIGLFVRAGARGVSLDAALISDRDDDALGETIEAGIRIFLGAVPSLEPPGQSGVRALLAPVQARWARLGFGGARLAEIVVTPSCGLAGASPSWARTAMRRSRDLARALDDLSHEAYDDSPDERQAEEEHR
jgi:Cobalamin-independent synthase, Catalytic domain